MYVDDKQVVDLVASMRRKVLYSITMTALLAQGFDGGSDFIHVVVDYLQESRPFNEQIPDGRRQAG